MHNSLDNIMEIENHGTHKNENIYYFTNCLLNSLRGINMGGDKIMKHGGKTWAPLSAFNRINTYHSSNSMCSPPTPSTTMYKTTHSLQNFKKMHFGFVNGKRSKKVQHPDEWWIYVLHFFSIKLCKRIQQNHQSCLIFLCAQVLYSVIKTM